MMLSMLWPIIALVIECAQGVINVETDEQYVCVARSEEHVMMNGLLSPETSLFIGLFHLSVTNGSSPSPTIETTVWHQIEFAANITINGPAAPGALPPPGMQILPLLTLANTNAMAGAINCPIRGTWMVDSVFMGHLRNSKLFCEVRSSTLAGSGNIRGQIYSRRDALVAFLGDSAENGMGVFLAHMLTPETTYLDYWILSKSVSATSVFQAIRVSDGYLPVAVFASNNVNNDTSLGVKRWISVPEVKGPVVLLTDVFTGFPFTGPGSSNLILTNLDSDTISRYTQFYRIAIYSDIDIMNTNGTGYSKTGRTFWQTGESAALYVVIVAVFALALALAAALAAARGKKIGVKT